MKILGWVVFLPLALLALTGVFVAAVLWSTPPLELARRVLPPEVVLESLEGVGLGWSGGEVAHVALTIERDQMMLSGVHLDWTLALDVDKPMSLKALSIERGQILSSMPEVPERDAATVSPIGLADPRHAAWWPLLSQAEVSVGTLEWRRAEQQITLSMPEPASVQRGGVRANLNGSDLEMHWHQPSASNWQLTLSLSGQPALTAELAIAASVEQLDVSGTVLVPEFAAEIDLEATAWPFSAASAQEDDRLVALSVQAALPLPPPLEGRGVVANARLEADRWGSGDITVVSQSFSSPHPDESLDFLLHTQLLPGWRMQELVLERGQLVLEQIAVGPHQLDRVATQFSGAWMLPTASGQLATSDTYLELAGAEGWYLTASSSGLTADIGATLAVSGFWQLDARTAEFDPPPLDALISLSQDGALVAADVAVSASWGELMTAQAHYDVERESADFQGSVDSRFWNWREFQTVTGGLYPELAELEVTSLDLRLAVAGSWRAEELALQVTGQAREGYFSRAGLGAAGLRLAPFELALSEDGKWVNAEPIRFAADAVNAGVQLENLVGQVEQDAQGWVLIEATAEALGGTLVIDRFRDFSSDGPLGTVYLRDFDLAEMMSLAGTQGVDVAGRATATLPLVWKKGQVLVDHGALRGTPGQLRYAPAIDPSQVDQRVGAVAAALSNLHFEQLDADVTLNEDGVLFLKTTVLGSNPDYQNGRQVKLNLTLENNLLNLLKSLQTVDSVNVWVTRQFERDTRQ